MKTSVFFQILTILVFANQNIFAQQSTKTLVQSFEIKDISEVTIDIPNVTVEVKEWNNLSEMRIQMEVSANMPETTFKSIVMAGRYNIVNTKNSNLITLTMPALKRQVVLSGKELKEKISFLVYVPSKIKVNTAPDLLIDNSTTAEMPNIVIKN